MAQQQEEVKYMTEEDYANYNPQDFNSQAQFQLSDFITQSSLYRRKISYKAFADFNDLVFDRREELRDQEYMDIMERLARLLPHVGEDCKCVPGSNQFCNSGIDEFLYCQNYPKWAASMPQIEFFKFYREHPNYSSEQFNEFLAEFCGTPFQIHIGVNPENINKDSIKINYHTVIRKLLVLCEAGQSYIERALLIIMNFKFCLENLAANWEPDMRRFFAQIHSRCEHLSEQCKSPIRQKLMTILGCQDCPFKIIQKLMEDNRHFAGFEDIPA
jgi:hypothetical protein